MTRHTPPPGFDERRFKALERSGFNRIAARYADGAWLRASLQTALLEAAALAPGEHVLDLAAGPGLLARDAARQVLPGGWVLASDIAEGMLAEGQRRATAAGLPDLLAAACDAEHLPFGDGSFDVALSTFGVMFTPDHGRSAGELLRVVRQGGRIGLASWTPDSFIGQLFKVIGKAVPPPAGLMSPSLWGTEAYLGELFGDASSDIRTTRRNFYFRYKSGAHWLQVFRDFYGPVNKAFGALDSHGQALLEQEILALLDRYNIAGNASMVVPSEYLEAVIVKRSG